MSKVLIANDDKKVIKKIKEIVNVVDSNIEIISSESYQDTLKKIHEIKDLSKLILDITMPTYKIKKHDDGATFRRSAGIDILNRINLYNINIKVVLLTRLGQFYDNNDIEKNDFISIKNDIENNRWKCCLDIIRFKDDVELDWKESIELFIKAN